MKTKNMTSGQKAAKTRKEKYEKASPEEKKLIDKKRQQAAIKASKNKQSKLSDNKKTSKIKKITKKPNMIKAGKDAERKKKRTEGLSNPEGKKLYYDVMTVYSKRKGHSKPICFCCKLSDWKFLVLDHIRNRSKDHKNYSGVSMAKKLKRDEYPSGIQVLCHNCNTGKEIFGGIRCPHLLSKKGQNILKNINLPIGKILRK
jgi:hypothetical protein